MFLHYPRDAALLIITIAMMCASERVEASLTHSNPFHPEQCDLAIASATRALRNDAADSRARDILAQGLLCRGLTQDDPWALEVAARHLQERTATAPNDFFLRLYLAEALRRRFPLDDRVPGAFADAAARLNETNLGAAAPALRSHVADALESLAAHRKQQLPRLRALLRELQVRAPTPDRLDELITLLGATGPSGRQKAQAILDVHRGQYDHALGVFYRAEILSGHDPHATTTSLYRTAEAALCRADRVVWSDKCARARSRLAQIETLAAAQGGMQWEQWESCELGP